MTQHLVYPFLLLACLLPVEAKWEQPARSDLAQEIKLDVNPVAPGGVLKPGDKVEFSGTGLQEYGVESELLAASTVASASDAGRFVVGNISGIGIFRIRVTNKTGKEGKDWWAIVTAPDPGKNEYMVKWTGPAQASILAKEGAAAGKNAWQKLWSGLRSDKDIRSKAFKQAADKYLTQNFLSAQATALTCAVAITPLAQASCAISVAQEVIDFFGYFLNTATSELQKKKVLTAEEVSQIENSVKSVSIGANSLGTAVDLVSLKKGQATALEVGTSLAAMLGNLTEFVLGDQGAGNDTFQVAVKLSDTGNALAVKHSALLTIVKKVK